MKPSSSLGIYEQFLDQYRCIQEGESRLVISKFDEFLMCVTPILQRLLAQRRRTASRFNIFNVLRISSLEQYHSLLLAFLLDPRAPHDQGDKFLCGFIETVLGLPPISGATSNTLVVTEESAEPFGRLDIKLYFPSNRQIVIVENKVNASEGDQQLARYQDWLATKLRPLTGEHRLIFLTPEGRRPRTDLTGTVQCVSYRALGDWLSSELGTLPTRLQVVLSQYIEICYALAGEIRSPEMMDELCKLLRDPEKLGVALDISEAVGALQKDIANEFWRTVREILESKLKQNGHDVKWEVYMDNDVWASLSKLGLVWKARMKNNFQFGFLFENLAGRAAYYGVMRGKEISVESLVATDKSLSEDLAKQKSFSKSSWWPGYRYLSKLNLDQFVGVTKENTIALLKDNLTEGHPLAEVIASLLWDLFDEYRLRVEELNQRYPY